MKNTFGNSVAVTLFGESHGEYIGAVLDGLAPGIEIDREYIEHMLTLRRPDGKISTPRKEKDEFRIVSGVINGKTTGTPLTILIPNENVKLSTVIEFINLIGISSVIDYTHTVSPFTVLIPEFKYQNISNCTEILSKCGLSRAFSVEHSGFSSISETPVPLYISEIYSAVSLSFGAEGMTAGGSTSASSVPTVTETAPLSADILYDHPFIYIVYDQNNVPLFIGNVVTP